MNVLKVYIKKNSSIIIYTSVALFIGTAVVMLFKGEGREKKDERKRRRNEERNKKRGSYEPYIRLKKTFLSDNEEDDFDETDMTYFNSRKRSDMGRKCVFYSDYEVKNTKLRHGGKLKAEKEKMDDLYFAMFNKLQD